MLALTGHKNPIIFNEFEHIALHPGQQSSLVRKDQNGGETTLGWLGRLHPKVEQHYGVANVVAFELELDSALLARLPEFVSVSRFPSIKRDLSVVVPEDIAVSKALDLVRNELGSALQKIELFDVYRGPEIQELLAQSLESGAAQDAKSISVSLVLQHADKTMTDDEAEVLMGAALAVLETEFGAQLRS